MLEGFQKLLFSILILLIPSQLAVHLWPAWTLISGIRIDYLSPALFFTDILIIFLLVAWMFEWSRPWKKIRIEPYILSVGLFVVTNILFSRLPLLSLVGFIRIILYVLFYYFLVHHRHFVRILLPRYLVFSLIWICTLAVLQFLSGANLGGVLYWVGERPLSMSAYGIARVGLGNAGWFLRPYATFPHPNALSGFVLLSGLMLVYLKKISVPGALLFLGPLVILTFSRTSLIIFLIYVLNYMNYKHRKIFSVPFVLFALFALSFFLFRYLPPGDSLSDRISMMSESLHIIGRVPVFGVGLETYPFVSVATHQPVHNIFLLVLSEVGIIGCLLLYPLMRNLIGISIRNTGLIYAVFLVIITGMVDHYWITSHQNILLLIIFLSMIPVFRYEF